MDDASSKGPARYANGRFGPGHTGRPLGSRNRMSKKLALGLLHHYAEHEAEILEKLNRYYFTDYVRLIGRLLPRPPAGDAPDLEAMPAEDVEFILGAVRAALGRIEAGEGSLADIEAALAGVSLGPDRTANNGAETAGADVIGHAQDAVPEPGPPLIMEDIW